MTNFGVYAVYQNNTNISYNTIQKASDGFGMIGIYLFGTNSTFTCTYNDISGTGTSYFLGAPSNVPTEHYGILSEASGTNLTASNNTIVTTISVASVAQPAYGISFVGGTNLTANNNNITTNQVGDENMYGIITDATGTVIINNNAFTAYSAGMTAKDYAAIQASGTAVGGETIQSNTFRNITTSITSGNMYLISASNNTNNVSASFNSTAGTISKTGAGGNFYGYNNVGTPTGGTATLSVNNFSNISVTGATVFYGIRHNTAAAQTQTININTISNITAGSSAVTGIDQGGGATNSTISNNTISNITSTGPITGIKLGTTTAAVDLQCSFNQLNTLYTTGGGANVTGINSTLGTSNSLFKNKIFDLQSNNATGTVYGISVPGGTNASTTAVYNNLIGDLKAPATSSASDAVRGISLTSASTSAALTLHYNTIYLSATSSGANFSSSCIFHTYNTTSTTAILNLRNNILVNASTPNGTGLAVALRRSASTNLNNFATTSNKNILYAGAASATHLLYYDGTNSDQTLVAYKARVSPREANSFSELPPFLSTSGLSGNFLHLNPNVATAAESGAANIAGITNDYDQEIRQGNAGYTGSGTAPDIGADEFESTVDVTAPDIIFTSLGNSCSTGDRTLSGVLISDAGGVPTAGALVPRVYYKKNVGGTWYSRPGTLSSGTGYNGTWSFTIVAADMGGLSVADVVYYYVIAQDGAATPNVKSSPAGVNATNVNTIISPPAVPASFKVTIMNGTYTVGTGGTFTTLTDAVNEYNISCITGPVVFSLTDADYLAETYPIVINSNAYQSATNTLTIRPASGVNANFSGNAPSTLLKLNGADYVTIDGSNSGGTDRSLSFTNNYAGAIAAVIWLSSPTAADGATFNTIKNCNIAGAGAAGTFSCIVAGGTTLGSAALISNSNNSIQNNYINSVQEGIYIRGYTGANLDQNWLITGNLIGSTSTPIGFDGLWLRNLQNYTVTGNTIAGVRLSGAATVSGMYLDLAHANGTITKNIIHNVKNITVSAFGSAGIYLSASTTTSNVSVTNNYIYDIIANGNGTVDANGHGIYAAAGGGYKIYYNTVSLNTNQVTTTGTTAAMIINGVTTASSLDIRNNIFVNQQTTAAPAATRYSIYSANSNTVFSNINYNDYYTTGTNLGYIGSNRTTLANVVTGFGGNANSINVLPNFISTTDFHLVGDNNCALDGTGNNSGILLANDFDGDSRSIINPYTTDIGADEYVNTFVFNVVNPAAVCSPETVDITAAAVTAGSTSGNTLSYWMDAACTTTIPPANGVPAAITVGGTYYIRSVKGSCSIVKPVVVTIGVSNNLAGVVGSATCQNKTVAAGPTGTVYTDASCNLIAKVVPSGGAPVSGTINTCVTLDAAQQYFNAEPYVKRHMDIEPATSNITTTSATITLYFTDAEFVNFNTTNPAWPKLPTVAGGANGDANRTNVRITQYHGTPTTTPSKPGFYTGNAGLGVLITPTPANVFWNGFYWAVTFNITGFSGFYLHSRIIGAGPLPISLNYLTGTKQGNDHLLKWSVTCNTTPRATLTLERSGDARTFNGIYTISADALRCQQPFDHLDTQPLKGMNYYRLKMTDADGKITYSNTIALLNASEGFALMSIAPNPVVGNTFTLNATAAKTTKMDLVISDMQGRILSRQVVTLTAGYNSTTINVDNLAAGTYNVYGSTPEGKSQVLRFVKQ